VKLSALAGQPHALKCLRSALSSGRVGGAYLFHGPRGTGKRTAALAFAASLNCENRAPDLDACGTCQACRGIEGRTLVEVIRVAPSGSEEEQDAYFYEWSESGRKLKEELARENPESKRGRRDSFSTNRVGAVLGWAARSHMSRRTKVCIMSDVHLMSHEASNHFLKMLEEPPPGTVWVLLTQEPESLPATIRSRCQPVRFTLLSRETVAGILAARSEPSPEEAAELMLGMVSEDAEALRAGLSAGGEFIAMAEMFDLAGLCERAAQFGKKGEDPDGLLDGIERQAAAALRAGRGDPDRWISVMDAVSTARWRMRNYIERAALDALGADLSLALGEGAGKPGTREARQ